jgi:hypothetical protein
LAPPPFTPRYIALSYQPTSFSVAVLHAPLPSLIALLLVVAVIALVAWALQLMQAANDRREFSLMLAGCMVCSAAVGLATVMLITLTGPEWGVLSATPRTFDSADPAAADLPLSLPASFELPWDGQI